MARGNTILVQAGPQGRFVEGFIATAEKPGTVMQMDPTVPVKSGRHTWKVYTPGTDGARPFGPLIVLLEDTLQGRTTADAYVAGNRCFGYVPQAGEEINVLLADVAGTADSHALGEQLMIKNASGKAILATGTPGCVPFTLLEAVVAPAADTLAWTVYSGY